MARNNLQIPMFSPQTEWTPPDELKDLSDQLDLTFEDEEIAWKSITPGVKQKVRRKKTNQKTSYGKWEGNL